MAVKGEGWSAWTVLEGNILRSDVIQALSFSQLIEGDGIPCIMMSIKCSVMEQRQHQYEIYMCRHSPLTTALHNGSEIMFFRMKTLRN